MRITTANPALDTALLAIELGLSPLAPREDGTKAPLADIPVMKDGRTEWKWEPYQATPATEKHIRKTWFKGDRRSIGLVTGYGGLECLEWDDRATFDAYLEAAEAVGLADLVERVRAGYEETTPGGGIHWLYRVDESGQCTKLASRADPTEENPNKVKTLIETKALGGFVIIAPSNGKVHPSGGKYEIRSGGLEFMATLTAEERGQLWDLARTFDEKPEEGPKPEEEPRAGATAPGSGDFPDTGVKPGDDFNGRMTWEDVLEPLGWQKVYTRGKTTYWRRPGKDRGISATTGHCKDLKVFSTSTPLATQGTHTKLFVYSQLQFGGDWTKTIKALVEAGFGTWIDNDGTEKPNPPPKGWRRAKKKESGGADEEKDPPINRTELGNARRLVRMFGDRIRHCRPWRAWFIWSGSRWERDVSGEIFRLAKMAVQAIGREAAEASDDEERKALLRWALSSESRRAIENMAALAESEPGIAVKPDEWDRSPWLFNCLNGTIDLRTGELCPHRKDDLLTMIAPVSYDPDAKAPRWEQFEREIFAGDADLIRYMRRTIGYSLTGSARVQELVIAHGEGSNGKNAYFDTIRKILGDYGCQAEPNLLLQAGSERHPTGVADLHNRRYVIASETDDGKRLAEALVKRLTGDGIIKARRMREDFFEFSRTFKVFLATNHRPEIKGCDHAIWRRIRLAPFNVKFVKEGEPIAPPMVLREDLTLGEVLEREGSGILALMVKGCLEWQSTGINPPKAVIAATEDYRAEMDQVREFIGERCNSFLDHETLRTQAKEKASDVFAGYQTWAKENSYEPMSKRTFGGQMEARGYRLEKSNSTCWRLGIQLKPRGMHDPEPTDNAF